MFSFVIALEFFSIGLIFVALLLLLNGDGAHEQKLLIFCMCSSLVQNVGYLLELTSPTVDAAVTAVTVENVGSAFVQLLLYGSPENFFKNSRGYKLFLAPHGNF